MSKEITLEIEHADFNELLRYVALQIAKCEDLSGDTIHPEWNNNLNALELFAKRRLENEKELARYRALFDRLTNAYYSDGM